MKFPNKIQVPSHHYNFKSYMNKRRWMSTWHQVTEILDLGPSKMLEIGPGRGYLESLIKNFGIDVETVDLDQTLNPTFCGNLESHNLSDNSYDLVCAFQVLEHLPYQESLSLLGEMLRISKKDVLISIPNLKTRYPISITFPKIGEKRFYLEKFFFFKKEFEFNGQHYWELECKQVPLKKFIHDVRYKLNANVIKEFRVAENGYHHFFVLSKNV